jgi:hypothetical protein
VDRIISYEMAITHKEFFRLLPAATRNLSYRVVENIVDIRDGAGLITIELENEARKKIASLSLPVTRLSIKFNGISDMDINIFLQHFLLVFQKGGG